MKITRKQAKDFKVGDVFISYTDNKVDEDIMKIVGIEPGFFLVDELNKTSMKFEPCCKFYLCQQKSNKDQYFDDGDYFVFSD